MVTLVLLSFGPQVNPQHLELEPVTAPYSAFIEGKAFHIAGGTMDPSQGVSLHEMPYFTIDLSVSWNTSSPIAEQQRPSDVAVAYTPSALSSDGQHWVMYSSGTLYAYSFITSTWATFLQSIPGASGSTSATTDPESGLMYFPNLLEGSMMRLNFTGKAYEKVPMPTPLIPSRFFSVAWSQVIGKMLFVGGTTGTTGQLDRLNMYSYSPQGGWVDLEKDMNGQIPEARSSACFVPAYGGSNMILFGGFKLGNASVHPDIYVLDVTTMKWTRGLNVALSEQRAEAACAFSNDQFIAWGGRAAGKPLNSTVVYNLKTSRWVPLYTAPEHPTATNGTTPSTPSPSGITSIDNSGDNSSRVVIIAIGVLGTLIVVLGSGILLYRAHCRRAKNLQHTSPMPREQPIHDDNQPLDDSSKWLGIVHVSQNPVVRSENPSEEPARQNRRNPHQPVSRPWSQSFLAPQPQGPHALLPDEPALQ